ncbi:uncharacterized protein B0H64DRAFT_410931 [Chaetomium fimeti]|uniref:Secreted protein n=1 Tax=Chaetomium fimeti TaxID=1854472 RepID=A0AAE0H6M3_9PEZI|nr:hypothetical protein B0H64DRAFT_410931 [Chaetomium fimeti]
MMAWTSWYGTSMTALSCHLGCPCCIVDPWRPAPVSGSPTKVLLFSGRTVWYRARGFVKVSQNTLLRPVDDEGTEHLLFGY